MENPGGSQLPWFSMFNRLLPILAACLLTACAATPKAAPDSLDAIAIDFVKLPLEAGVREEGYVDAYYGPPE